MHVLYFLLKKLMEPPFSEYLVLLKNRVTFSYSFIYHHYKYFNFTSKLIKRSQQRSIDSKGIPKQSESEKAPRDKKQRDQTQASKFSNSSV
jgi:hypothetical protein